MFSRKLDIIGRSLATLVAAGAMFLASATAEAAMAPHPPGNMRRPISRLAWCAVGAHIGRPGASIGGPGWGPDTTAIAGTINGAAGSATDRSGGS